MTRTKTKERSTAGIVPAKIPQTGEEYGLFTHAGLEWSPLLRMVGRDKALQTIIAQWGEHAAGNVSIVATADVPAAALVRPIVSTATAAEDYAQLDLKLAIQATPILSEEPRPGTGYAGFTPTQRYHFLQWLGHVDLAAPAAFRHLYLAQLETNLFDKPHRQQAAHQELYRLADIPTWQGEERLWRALLLSFRLAQQGAALSHWLAGAPAVSAALLGIAFGQLALFGQPLTIAHLTMLLHRWQSDVQLPEQSILQLRLSFLTNALGAEPLAYLRAQLGEAAEAPTPWRCAHRDLRVRLAQPDLRPALVPLLRELSTLTERIPAIDNDNIDNVDVDPPLLIAEEDAAASYAPGRQSSRRQKGAKKPKGKWQLVLEFGESRSEFFTLALNQATCMPGYLQIMDENRRMIHRVHFEKAELRRFWILWEYVQSWSSTQVYMNGKELQKWEIYPYSPYLR